MSSAFVYVWYKPLRNSRSTDSRRCRVPSQCVASRAWGPAALIVALMSHNSSRRRPLRAGGCLQTGSPGGKVMMDKKGDDLPKALQETTADSIKESVELLEKWHNSESSGNGCCHSWHASNSWLTSS